MKKRIIDDKYENIKNDIDKIRTKPSVYISHVGEEAVLHLVCEALNNVFDEHKNPNSVSDGDCRLHYDEEQNSIYVSDTGRGIPFEELENACTIIHSGTKLHRAFGSSAGENGVGLTAINALSEHFEISSYRNGKMKFLSFCEGKKTADKEIDIEEDRHGLSIMFRPSSMILGKDCMLPVDRLDLWLTKLSFKIDPKIIVNFTCNMIGKEASITKTYQNVSGISGFLSKLYPEANLLKSPIVVKGDTTILEENIPISNEKGEIVISSLKRNINIELAINYNPDTTETVKFSFCNDIETIEHGKHVDAAITSIVNTFRKKIKEDNLIKGKEKEITNNDILCGLSVVVFIDTDYSTALFTGQTKHKMDNVKLYDPIRKKINQMLEDYFILPENKKTLSAIAKTIQTNINARLAFTKTKTATSKKRSLLEANLIIGYNAPNFIEQYKSYNLEIYIVEGNSAQGSARAGRVNCDIQGILGVQGKLTNCYGITPKLMMTKKDIIRIYDEILGCGYDSHFNIDNLIYDKVIMMPDADVDGHHIFGLFAANTLDHARGIIEEGHFYRAVTPLYSLKEIEGKKHLKRSDFLYSKNEIFSLYEKRVSQAIRLKKAETDRNYLSSSSVQDFLKVNRDYFEILNRMSKIYNIHRDIIEFMTFHTDFWNIIHEEFKDMHYQKEKNLIDGIYQGAYNIILMNNKKMFESLEILRRIVRNENDNVTHYYAYKISPNKKAMPLGKMTIGQIIAYCQPYIPKLSSRFKGLGELDNEEIKDVVMDPSQRTLIRFTIQDAEAAKRTFDELFLNDQIRRVQRKNIISTATIDIEDIDN